MTSIRFFTYTGTVVGQVDATDADGFYNTITYSLDNSSDYFAIDKANGSIKTLQMFQVVANNSEVRIFMKLTSTRLHSLLSVIIANTHYPCTTTTITVQLTR